MLTHLSIRNYALIDYLNIEFPSGLITITGETGAGKSIILGALKLVLGERADFKSLKNEEEKCFIEANFQLDKNIFNNFFTANDLDFEENTIIRREILPSGKSRAFINDTPVNLSILQELSDQLIDIHSQFDSSKLLNEKYQLDLLDYFSGTQSLVSNYQTVYNSYISAKKELAKLQSYLNISSQDLEYNQFILEELQAIDLESIDFYTLEKELNLMKNSEYLAQVLEEVRLILENEEVGILTQTQEVFSKLEKGSHVSLELEKLSERMTSIKVELHDILSEVENLSEKLEFDPVKFEKYTNLINMINSLFQKHRVSEIKDLIEIRDALLSNTSNLTGLEEDIKKIEKKIESYIIQLKEQSSVLHEARIKHIPMLEEKILEVVGRLDMDKSAIKIQDFITEDFTPTGTDKISILFSANTGMEVLPIAKAISGGERSRVMLAVKKIMAENQALPTLILDEIDMGVSGRVANEIGKLMQEMATTMQLIVITHLPQVAAKGSTQFKVEKNEVNKETVTGIRELSREDRVTEIAQLISGAQVTELAKQQAIELLKS